ncbi:hypothetical protein ST201phi2-1p444 [Pseudomonas phage 201phi2-1]|uniref:Uncharacterized protein n=1 Tax=Pseudomonas phage 201phi2-1 TaxID=198110 RepID=B3FJV2_BP201|nr:hypothetical protein ST201phi2-1p444 [Pseudomonas phage 201phi2-1]ABY63267.1 hypothetical protein 201phi2-1p444 [Pseudomonas phage 201phi2-1]
MIQTNLTGTQHDPYDEIAGPDKALIQYYATNLRTYIEANILCDSSHTLAQKAAMLESFLLDLYKSHLARDALAGRDTYWKPRVTHTDRSIDIYLSNYMIGTLY